MIPVPWFAFLEPGLITALLSATAMVISLVLWWLLVRRVQALERQLAPASLSTSSSHLEAFDRQGLRRSIEELLRLSEQLAPGARSTRPAPHETVDREGTSP